MRYKILPNNRYFQANRSIVEYEIKPAYTVTFVSEVDLSQVMAMRQAAGDRKPSFTAFVVKAAALALKDYPYANRRVCRRPWLWFLGPRLQKFETCDIAVAAERDMPGVEFCAFADIIRDADEQSMDDINDWLRELATCDVNTNKQWREFSTLITRLPRFLSTLLIRLPIFVPSLWSKYRGGAVLISSPAKYGVDSVLTTWTWPLGISFGFVKDRPIAVDGELVVRPTFNLTLNFDRRVMAGAQGARFFKRMVDALENAHEQIGPHMQANDAPASIGQVGRHHVA